MTRPDISDPQLGLFEPRPMRFDGEALEPDDHRALGGQLRAVADLLADGRARTPREIAESIGCSDASATSRVRDLRKPRFGGHRVERERIGPRLYAYRLVVAR